MCFGKYYLNFEHNQWLLTHSMSHIGKSALGQIYIAIFFPIMLALTIKDYYYYYYNVIPSGPKCLELGSLSLLLRQLDPLKVAHTKFSCVVSAMDLEWFFYYITLVKHQLQMMSKLL